MHSSLFQPSLSLLLSLLLIPVLKLSGDALVYATHGTSGPAHHNIARRHNAIPDALHSNATNSYNGTNPLERRGPGAQMTFFKPGLGACGSVNRHTDFIVALNQEQFDQGGQCFKPITIRVGGRTAQATIVDRCVSCGFGNIDLTLDLFKFLGGTEQGGILNGDWEYGSGGSPAPPPPKAKPTTTRAPPPPPPPTSTSKSRAQPTSTSSQIPPTSTQASTSAPASSSTLATSVPNPSASAPADQGNLSQLYLGYIGMAGVAWSAANQA